MPAVDQGRRASVLRAERPVVVPALPDLGQSVLPDPTAQRTAPVLPGDEGADAGYLAGHAQGLAEGRALATADAWLTTVASGDAAAGWELLGPMSREAQGSSSAYATALRGSGDVASSSLALAFSPLVGPDRTVDAVAPLGPGTFAVVITTPSATGPVPHLLAVVTTRSGQAVEPFLPGPALDLIGIGSPADGGHVLQPGDPIPLRLDPGAAATVVVVDGVVAPDGWLTHGPDGGVTGVSPQPQLRPGPHRVAVAELLAGGTIAGDVRAFPVGSGGDAGR